MTYDRIAPGEYRLHASKADFRDDPDAGDEKTIEVLPQACAWAQVGLLPISSVSGTVRSADGAFLADVPVELVGAGGERKREDYSADAYDTKTDESGAFRFEHVLPGRYLLGTNIMSEEFATSHMPRAYHPGWSEREKAIEINVTAGADSKDLQFRLPDAGPRRAIRMCVADPAGRPVPEARVHERGGGDGRYGHLGDNLQTGSNGCVTANGYERASYEVSASSGVFQTEFRASESVNISSGKGPLNVVLVLRPLKP